MKHWLIIGSMVILSACGAGSKDDSAKLKEKKAELEKLKKAQTDNNAKIKSLEEEIAKLDTSAAKATTLVSVMTIAVQDFSHSIDLQGKVDADNISYVGPRGAPGQVKALYVKKGDLVRSGQLLLKLDDAVIRQQIQSTNTQLTLAKDIYRRQKNLWDQGIGTEVQVINAKNAVDQLENALKLQNEQLSMTNVYADVSGVADQVNVRVGEIFSGYSGNVPQIMIVNTSSLKVATDIPENYLTRVKKGSPVDVIIPDVSGDAIKTSISLISQSINVNSRGFIAEAKIPYNALLKPNQVAIMHIHDYAAKDAIAIPVNTVQTDDQGKYVYVAVQEGANLLARKKHITVGELSGELIEVKSGLNAGEQLITEGYQGAYDGQNLKVNK